MADGPSPIYLSLPLVGGVARGIRLAGTRHRTAIEATVRALAR
jgi:hypothetical protein